MKDTKKEILNQTDGGWDVFEHYIIGEGYQPPRVKPTGKEPSKKFKFRKEETASSSLQLKGDSYYFKDFGDAEKAINCFDFVMKLKGIGFKESLQNIIDSMDSLNIQAHNYGKKTPDFSGKESALLSKEHIE